MSSASWMNSSLKPRACKSDLNRASHSAVGGVLGAKFFDPLERQHAARFEAERAVREVLDVTDNLVLEPLDAYTVAWVHLEARRHIYVQVADQAVLEATRRDAARSTSHRRIGGRWRPAHHRLLDRLAPLAHRVAVGVRRVVAVRQHLDGVGGG